MYKEIISKEMLTFKPDAGLGLCTEYYIIIGFIDLYKYWLLRYCIFVLCIVQKIKWSSPPDLAEVDMLNE